MKLSPQSDCIHMHMHMRRCSASGGNSLRANRSQATLRALMLSPPGVTVSQSQLASSRGRLAMLPTLRTISFVSLAALRTVIICFSQNHPVCALFRRLTMASTIPPVKRFMIPSMNTSGHGNASGNFSANTTQIAASFGLFSKQMIVEEPPRAAVFGNAIPAMVATGAAIAVAGYAVNSAITKDSKERQRKEVFESSCCKSEARKIAEDVMGISDEFGRKR